MQNKLLNIVDQSEKISNFYTIEISLKLACNLYSIKNWDTIEDLVLDLIHLAAYVFAKIFSTNNLVLEIGCGTGYGVNYLSQCSSRIIAIDISNKCISHCYSKYKRKNMSFLIASGIKLPFRCNIFKTITSFQVIEHIQPSKIETYLSEVKKVLRKGGIFIVSTPNRKLRLLPFQKPWNIEHKKEYDYHEIKFLLNKMFKEVKVFSLCGSKDIQIIEYNRVKQKPLNIYIINPFKSLIKKILKSINYKVFRLENIEYLFKRDKVSQTVKDQFYMERFKFNNFYLYPNYIKNAIDIYACARK